MVKRETEEKKRKKREPRAFFACLCVCVCVPVEEGEEGGRCRVSIGVYRIEYLCQVQKRVRE